MKSLLAINGGKKLIKKIKFKYTNNIGSNEIKAAVKVIKSGKLSGFLGTP